VRLQGTKYARQEGRHKLVQTFVDIVARDCGSVAPTIEAVDPSTRQLGPSAGATLTTRNRANRKTIVGQPATEASGPSRWSADGSRSVHRDRWHPATGGHHSIPRTDIGLPAIGEKEALIGHVR
jgi:hypothetical protein